MRKISLTRRRSWAWTARKSSVFFVTPDFGPNEKMDEMKLVATYLLAAAFFLGLIQAANRWWKEK